MKAVKGIYHNGGLSLAEPVEVPGPVEVIVVFPDDCDDPWRPILEEASPRPAFEGFMREALEQIDQGKAEPLNLDQL